MKSLEHITTYYFIGIGGIGMSALARYFKVAGRQVYGYDKTPGLITRQLEELGISVHYNDDLEALPVKHAHVEETLVIYTPAVPESHTGFNYLRNHGFTLIKRAEVLGILTRDKYCLAVAGTHGKTTTSAILGHLLAEVHEPVTAFIGGIATNYDSNLIQRGSEVVVVEADEFDRSFMHLDPNIACITSIDADHLDIYGEATALEDSFKAFSKQVEENGSLLIKKGLPLDGITIGVDEDADYTAKNLRIVQEAYHFDLHYPQGVVKDFSLQLPGRHNVFNAITAVAMAMIYGLNPEKLREPLASFSGVNRRFTYRIRREDLVLIDDYAHHPAEIDAVYESLKELYPDEGLLVVFQPHLFSRTRDFIDDFARSLSRFDEVMLLDIYPAREEPIAGINSEALLERISIPRKRKVTKTALPVLIKESQKRVVALLGAGDIGDEILKVTKALSV